MASISKELPRRIHLELNTPAERAIRNAIVLIEAAGAHPELTAVVTELHASLDRLGDYVDVSGSWRSMTASVGAEPDVHTRLYATTDASIWADEFCKIAARFGNSLDQDWVTGWFANAIEVARASGKQMRAEALAIVNAGPEVNPIPRANQERAMTNEDLRKLKIGSIVRLASGGPDMTVAGWEAGDTGEKRAATRNQGRTLLDWEASEVAVGVFWFHTTALCREQFMAATLEIVS